jgi:glutathione S-transferase
MTAYALTALITLLVLILLFGVAVNVGMARGRYGIKAPATSGHDMFDRAYRIQMNTIESSVLMLPALWLCAGFYSDTRAAILGAFWLLARIWYAIGYQRNPASREAGFTLSVLAFALLWVGAMWGVARTLLG